MNIGIGIGIVILLYSLITFIMGKSYLFGGNEKYHSKQSVKLFAKLSALVELIAAAAVIIFSVAGESGAINMIRVISGAVIWLALAALVTLYIVILEKHTKN